MQDVCRLTQSGNGMNHAAPNSSATVMFAERFSLNLLPTNSSVGSSKHRSRGVNIESSLPMVRAAVLHQETTRRAMDHSGSIPRCVVTTVEPIPEEELLMRETVAAEQADK